MVIKTRLQWGFTVQTFAYLLTATIIGIAVAQATETPWVLFRSPRSIRVFIYRAFACLIGFIDYLLEKAPMLPSATCQLLRAVTGAHCQ